jgi:hypothetical protein
LTTRLFVAAAAALQRAETTATMYTAKELREKQDVTKVGLSSKKGGSFHGFLALFDRSHGGVGFLDLGGCRARRRT